MVDCGEMMSGNDATRILKGESAREKHMPEGGKSRRLLSVAAYTNKSKRYWKTVLCIYIYIIASSQQRNRAFYNRKSLTISTFFFTSAVLSPSYRVISLLRFVAVDRNRYNSDKCIFVSLHSYIYVNTYMYHLHYKAQFISLHLSIALVLKLFIIF